MSLQIVTPPTAEPVTIDEVKARLRLTTTADDALILQLITTARVFAEAAIKKSIVSKGYSTTLERFPWPTECIRLPVGPVSAVTSIMYMDPVGIWQTWPAATYLVGLQQLPAVILPVQGAGYPETYQAPGLNVVVINFNAGPATGALALAMDPYLEATRQLAAHFYSHPDAVNAENLKEMPLGIRSLLGYNPGYHF